MNNFSKEWADKMDTPVDDAPRDPKTYQAFRQDYTEQDFEGKSIFLLFLAIWIIYKVQPRPLLFAE